MLKYIGKKDAIKIFASKHFHGSIEIRWNEFDSLYGGIYLNDTIQRNTHYANSLIDQFDSVDPQEQPTDKTR